MSDLKPDERASVWRGWRQFRRLFPEVPLLPRDYLHGVVARADRLLACASSVDATQTRAHVLRRMHLADVGLAIACDLGVESAWSVLRRHLEHALQRPSRSDPPGWAVHGESIDEALGMVFLAGARARRAPFATLSGEAPLAAFVFGVLRNQRKRASRSERRRRQSELPADRLTQSTFSSPWRWTSALENASRLESVLDSALARLTDRQREVVGWLCRPGSSHSEVGAELGITKQAVAAHARRIRSALASALDAGGISPLCLRDDTVARLIAPHVAVRMRALRLGLGPPSVHQPAGQPDVCGFQAYLLSLVRRVWSDVRTTDRGRLPAVYEMVSSLLLSAGRPPRARDATAAPKEGAREALRRRITRNLRRRELGGGDELDEDATREAALLAARATNAAIRDMSSEELTLVRDIYMGDARVRGSGASPGSREVRRFGGRAGTRLGHAFRLASSAAVRPEARTVLRAIGRDIDRSVGRAYPS